MRPIKFRVRHKEIGERKQKKICKCKIRGVIELYQIKNGQFYSIHPVDKPRWLRKFKFCPLCGRKII